jgi:hypothetical protein
MEKLNLIVQYQMDETEAKAFKCAIMWEKFCAEFFERERFSKLRQKGDPRKSYLFRCCYTLVKDFDHIIENEDYKLYIYAQLEILKGITDGETHANIDPACLIGDKAWIRWKMWQKRYSQVKKFKNVEEVEIKADQKKVLKELEKTKDFLLEQFKGPPSKEALADAAENRTLLRWLHNKKVSPYFILLYPHLPNTGWSMDLGVFERNITPEVEKYFEELFNE